MTVQHRELAAGRWAQLPFLEQMAHIGGEVSRFISWKNKTRPDNSSAAFERALELIDLTLADVKNRSRLPELTRMREVLADFAVGQNLYSSTDASWMKYFSFFALAARRRY